MVEHSPKIPESEEKATTTLAVLQAEKVCIKSRPAVEYCGRKSSGTHLLRTQSYKSFFFFLKTGSSKSD